MWGSCCCQSYARISMITHAEACPNMQYLRWNIFRIFVMFWGFDNDIGSSKLSTDSIMNSLNNTLFKWTEVVYGQKVLLISWSDVLTFYMFLPQSPCSDHKLHWLSRTQFRTQHIVVGYGIIMVWNVAVFEGTQPIRWPAKWWIWETWNIFHDLRSF